jgi:hypothetical protein
MGIADEQGACLNNIDKDSLHSGLAWASDGGAVVGPVKGRLSEA